MLVSVLLARDTPLPLALGLFGDWGSGKSFFMALMEERMCELASLAAQGRVEAAPFVREVRPVRFNAWHYVDTDLWASLAATLFDELARTKSPDAAAVALEKLDHARQEADEARRRRERIERDVADLAARTAGVGAAARSSLSVAIRGVRNDAKLLPQLGLLASGSEGNDVAVQRLVNALGDVETVADKARAAGRLFQEEVLYRRRKATLATLGAFIAAAGVVWAVSTWSLGPKLLTLFAGVLAGLLPALNATVRVLSLARDAREARELPLVEKQEELDQAKAIEQETQREVERCEQQLAELRNRGQQLRDFVRERASSSDYRSKLGIMSQVRRDFEQLATLLAPGQSAGAQHVVAVAAEVSRQVPEVERIILFIDDLDRCPHDKVVEVLQAVHLLLAFKLFVVVVGVDSRWLDRSLKAHYANLLEEPERYLEKIFQIPFTLRRMTLPRYRELIAELTPSPVQPVDAGRRAGRSPGERPGGVGAGHGAPANSGKRTSTTRDLRQVLPSNPAERGAEQAPTSDQAGLPPEGNTAEDSAAPARDLGAAVSMTAFAGSDRPTVEPPPLPRPEALVISAQERDLLGNLGEIIPTPRAAKRLVNIYRMLRVSVPEDELDDFSPDGGKEYEAVVLLLGILVGRPSQSLEVFDALMSAHDDTDVREVLGHFPAVDGPLADLFEQITTIEVRAYRRWAPRVARFSFQLAGLPEDRELTVNAPGSAIGFSPNQADPR